jgi:DNA-binding transcriptional ArsR family regulator
MTTSVGDGKGDREIQDAVSYAIGHRIRIEILTVLHERADASAIELSRIVHQPLSTVTHHIGALLKSGSIQVERTEKVRSVEQRFYSLASLIYVSDEEWAEMSDAEREEVCRLLLQSIIAEALASFWAGEITADPRYFISWAWFNVDEQGRDDIAEEQIRSWQRIGEIEREATSRCAESGEKPFSLLVSSLSFNRVRDAPGRPPRPPGYRRRRLGRDLEDERQGEGR